MQEKIKAAPAIFYPESDGQPMAETDIHRDLMNDFIQMLKHHYRNEKDVYVSGNMFMYYVQGHPKKCVAPDVFVVFGVAKKQRDIYQTWAEGKTPDFVLEVASPSTVPNDLGNKKALYASVLKVSEYFIYDPLGQIVPSFVGYRLIDGSYEEMAFVNNRIPSEKLGLELGERDGNLRLYDPKTSQWLETPSERADTAEARADTAEARADTAEARAIQESNARQNAEARADTAEEELVKALEEIEQLRSQRKN